MPEPTLVVFSGLPGAGKTTLAAATAAALDCTHLSVDTAEAAMWRCGVGRDAGAGVAAYEVAAAVAEVQLKAGRDAVVDAVNAVAEARATWDRVGSAAGVPVVWFECVLDDLALHRARLEARPPVPDFADPTWADVCRRREEYAPWPDSVVRVETSGPVEELLTQVLERLGRLPSQRRR
ncbi:AAA family ATPase [Phytomonospora sp. NPDC050363]|uniref:AAA family ATPase n=1 Tax=Phytomonospora sp. NPDC050363 TaxID=3155642 RepID=UPI0033FEE835